MLVHMVLILLVQLLGLGLVLGLDNMPVTPLVLQLVLGLVSGNTVYSTQSVLVLVIDRQHTAHVQLLRNVHTLYLYLLLIRNVN